MTRYSKYNVIYLLQKWMDSVPGQTFLNYAYSWGASIVILGTLFKLTHIPGANLMLFIGMGTEVFVFFISAFDRPFDKTTDGMDLQTHYGGGYGEGAGDGSFVPEDGQIAGDGTAFSPEDGESAGDGSFAPDIEGHPGQVAAAYGGGIPGGAGGSGIPGGAGGGTIIIGGIGGQSADGTISADGIPSSPSSPSDLSDQSDSSDRSDISHQPSSISWVTQQQQVSPEMAEATENYVEELKRLTEMLGKVNEQSVRLTRDSEEMENLNRTLTGICKVYEMQLKGASQQIGTIDQINEQSKRMAQQIEQLNQIYTRMIEAMTVNMRGTTPAQPGTQPINLNP